ncbi:chemotaxis protein CheA [Thermatribacter velox]|uniref:Chemotaxis protein CheA n=1 Tax=Thermatribacter velox TaxID=3039681 RepID=A0ABZ2YAB1_9BACT
MTDSFDMERYLAVFLEEVEEHLQNLEEGLVSLERDPQNQELVQALFRSFHTIKGSSGSMGFVRLSGLAHTLENVLDRVRNKELEVTPSLVDLLLKGVDMIREFKESIAQTSQEPELDIGELEAHLKQFLAGGVDDQEALKEEDTGAHPGKVAESGENKASEGKRYQVRVFLHKDCSMKGVRAYLVLNRLQELGAQILFSEPTVAELEKENFGESFLVEVLFPGEAEAIRSAVLGVAEVEKVEVQEVEAEKEKEGQAAQREVAKSVQGIRKTVRVDVERLDNLMNLVGELVIDRARLENSIQRLDTETDLKALREQLADTSTHLGRITNELQTEIMKARMLPLAEVFNRFPRMVRDIARNSGKEVDFVIEGEETELDRSLLEEITDPLIHLLRNAIDHGIESPEERAAAGKPARGRVLLKAYQEENSVVIMVQDDGRGISLGKLKQKALERGLVKADELEKLSEKEIIDFIFHPGFSTAEEVTDVSGRGVGMDVVKRNIEKINGQVFVESLEGKGTTFYLRLPLTLAIVRALLVKVKEAIFAIPLSDVVEIERVELKNTYWLNQVLTTLFRGNTLPLVSLAGLLSGEVEATFSNREAASTVFYTVVVNAARSMAGLVVDEIIGEQEIVIKSLGEYIGDIRGLGGATILGDGTVSLILDVASLLAKFSQLRRFAENARTDFDRR